MPVYKLKLEMPYDEFVKWFAYFKRRPVGWREDNRAMMLLHAQGVKAKGREVFNSIRVMEDSETRLADGFSASSFKGSSLFTKLAGAVGGEKILDKL